jgi:hypothetical protein
VVWAEQPDSLVSGGAAWADHVAIGLTNKLFPSIPCHVWLPEYAKDLDIARYYHRKFSAVLGYDTWNELRDTCRDKRATFTMFKGFKDRNTKVAEAADVFLAITFGDGPRVKDGGTADTVGKLRARQVPGYHLDLNTMKLWKLTQ